jgi:hypothetical protein
MEQGASMKVDIMPYQSLLSLEGSWLVTLLVSLMLQESKEVIMLLRRVSWLLMPL